MREIMFSSVTTWQLVSGGLIIAGLSVNRFVAAVKHYRIYLRARFAMDFFVGVFGALINLAFSLGLVVLGFGIIFVAISS